MFYKFIGAGDFKTQYPKFFSSLRANTAVKSLYDDPAFKEFLLSIVPDKAATQNNLNSHGCGI